MSPLARVPMGVGVARVEERNGSDETEDAEEVETPKLHAEAGRDMWRDEDEIGSSGEVGAIPSSVYSQSICTRVRER